MQKKPKTVDPAVELANAKKRIKKLTKERNETYDWYVETNDARWKYKRQAEEWEQKYYASEIARIKESTERIIAENKRSMDALNESTESTERQNERIKIFNKISSILYDKPQDGDNANLDLIKQFRVQPKN